MGSRFHLEVRRKLFMPAMGEAFRVGGVLIIMHSRSRMTVYNKKSENEPEKKSTGCLSCGAHVSLKME